MDSTEFAEMIRNKPLNERVSHKISELKGKLFVAEDSVDIVALNYAIEVLESLECER